VRVRGRAFALMLVLIAAAGVFALVANGLVLLRSSTVETGAMAREAEARRAARAAAVMVLAGLVERPEGEGRGASALDEAVGEGGAGGGEGGVGEDEEEMEIPAWMREILGEAAEELEEEAEERRERRRGSAGGSGRARSRGSDLLRLVGLPAEPVVFEVGGLPVRVTLSDSSSGLSVNSASAEQLARYFREMGAAYPVDEAVANQIKDWTDADGFVRDRSVEGEWYEARGIEIRDDRMGELREMLYLPSVTPAFFERVRGGLTAGGGRLNLASANEAVLIGFGFSRDDVELIVSMRRGDGLDGRVLEERLSRRGSELLRLSELEAGPVVLVRVEVFGRRGPGEGEGVDLGAWVEEEALSARVFEGVGVVGSGGLERVLLRRAVSAGLSEEPVVGVGGMGVAR